MCRKLGDWSAVNHRAVLHRWMGGIRFTLGAVQQIMLSKTHAARVAILPQEQAEPLLQDVTADNGDNALSGHLCYNMHSNCMQAYGCDCSAARLCNGRIHSSSPF